METTNKKPFVWHGQKSEPSYSNWFNGYVTYIPIYVNEKFVRNICSGDKKASRREAAEQLIQLRKNNYKYFAFHGTQNVFDMLKMVENRKLHFEDFTEIKKIEEDLWEFHGNLQEVSAAFFYRIYDKKLIQQIIRKLIKLNAKIKTNMDELFELERQKEIAFQNACDCIYYGYGKGTWKSEEGNNNLDEETSNEIWHEAWEHMASQE